MHYDVIFKFYSWLILEIIICWRVSRCKYCDTVSYFAYSRLPNKQLCTLIIIYIFFFLSCCNQKQKCWSYYFLIIYRFIIFRKSLLQRTWTETLHDCWYVKNPVKSFHKFLNKRNFLKIMNVGFFLSFYIFFDILKVLLTDFFCFSKSCDHLVSSPDSLAND